MFAGCLIPTAVATHDMTLGVILLITAVVPVTTANAPATISSKLDDMMELLNIFTMLGDKEHKDRCNDLILSLERANGGQGLGFQVAGTVVDKKMLAKLAGAMAGAAGTLATFLIAASTAIDPTDLSASA